MHFSALFLILLTMKIKTMRILSLLFTHFYALFLLATLTQIQADHDHQTEKKIKKNHVLLVPVLASAVGVLGTLVIVGIIIWVLKLQTRRGRNKKSNQSSPALKIEPRCFSYAELVKITNNFQRRIGGLGTTVYHGCLDDTPVAVKIYPGERVGLGFQNEAEYLSKVRHKSLVNMIGYCNEGATKHGLIFEYMDNGDLKKILSENISNILSWEQRLRIAIDAAKALDYLHEGCKPAIIHRDVKSSNLLLSQNLEVKLSGFEHATSLPNDDTDHDTTAIVGTLGYLDIEYIRTGKPTVKSDVYSFGVVLMEIITVKPTFVRDEYEPYAYAGNNHITMWVNFMFNQGSVGNIVDQRLEGEFDINSVEEALKIAMACVSENSDDRPTMSQVVVKLKECLQMELSRLKEIIQVD